MKRQLGGWLVLVWGRGIGFPYAWVLEAVSKTRKNAQNQKEWLGLVSLDIYLAQE